MKQHNPKELSHNATKLSMKQTAAQIPEFGLLQYKYYCRGKITT